MQFLKNVTSGCKSFLFILILQASNLGIKINMKNLYQADGYSVRELIKPVSLLYNAYNVSNENMESHQNTNFHEIMSKVDFYFSKIFFSHNNHKFKQFLDAKYERCKITCNGNNIQRCCVI